ncbi:MAG: LamG domain-containing protein [Burkholderiales bacterium]|nr:LamG domain-containing protein [Bacteroidia bacterium]
MKSKLLLLSALTLGVFAMAQIPTTGLVAHYSFSGNANDQSGNSNNGTVNGATLTTDRFGNTNSAYFFNGTSGYIDVPHSSSLTFTANAISVSFWAKISSVPSSGYNGLILSKQSGSGATQQGFNVFDNTGQTVGLNVSNGGGNFGGSNNTLVSLNQYHHFTYTFNNGTAISYLDGVLTSSLTGQTASLGANTMNLLIGKANWTNINALNFNGVIDEIEIYNRAITFTEVGQIFTASCSNPNITTGLVAQFDFTGNANDLSINGNNGIINGATLVSDRFGNANSAFYYDGINNYIEIPNISAYNNQLYTISYWTKFSTTATPGSGGFNVNPALISKLPASNSVIYDNWVFYEGNGTPGFAYGTAGYGGSSALFNNNNWHNIICTVNSDSVRFYYDGIQSSSVAKGPNLIFNSQPIRIGRSTATYWKAFNGIIDDLKIYNRPLTDCDVDSLYSAPNPLATNISERNLKSNFSIYPNPANDKVSIELLSNLNQNLVIEVLDLMGSSIQKQVETLTVGKNKLEINLSSLSSGLYLIKCNNSIQKIQITR